VARVKGDEPRLQLLVNALVTLGRGDGWGSTNANAAALRALAERLSPPLPGTGRHTVRVRLGSELRTLALGPEAPLGRLVASAAEDGEVALEPGKNAGVLGVRAETTYVPAADGSRVAAQASGFVVSREWLRVQKGADVPPERVPLVQGTALALAVGDLVEEHVQVVNPEERHYVAVVVPLAALAALACVVVLVATRVRLVAPAPTLLLRDVHGRFLAEVPDARDPEVGYWPLARLPPRVVAATLAVEDRRFWRHPGVDPLAVVRGVGQNLRAGRRASGASTIAMQVARLERPGPRTYPRKLGEALAALVLTARYGHAAVLAHYLRIAPYGNRVRGIAYAARRYLGKP